MKYLTWDDPDPRVVFDNPNLRWGDPSYLLELGDPGYIELQPGQPGYVPPQPPRPRRRHRAPSSANPETTTTTTHMSDNSFHYFLRPNQSNPGTWSARADYQEDYTQAQLVADVVADLAAAGITLTPAQVAAAGEAMLRRILGAARVTRKTRNLFGMGDFSPTAGGVVSDINTPPTPGLLNIDLRWTFNEPGYTLYTTGMTFQREAVEGIRSPDIAAVQRFTDDLPDKYTAGAGFVITGTEFGRKPPLATNTNVGVFAIPQAGGTAVRVTAYSGWTNTKIGGTWPAALTGNHFVRVCTIYQGGTEVRSDETDVPMTP